MKIPFWPEFKGFRDIDLGLDRMYQALKRLDNPHKKLPQTIHIAGTNGKGSSLAFLRSIFEANNYRVHTYSSPHLVNFNERIYLAGKDIDDDFLNECLSVCKEACEIEPKISLTFFEGTTLAAFLAFSKVKADILILETGMGGRLDATNVLDRVLASIITPISIDHAEFLGDNLRDIAFEKAGIIKQDSLVVCGKQKDEALEVIQKRSSDLGSEFLGYSGDFLIEENDEKWIFKGFFNDDGKNLEIEFDRPRYLNQKHQRENLANILAFIFAQNQFKFDFKLINQGIVNAKWPARLEKITEGKFYEKIADKTNVKFELIIDGGHNGDAAKSVADFLQGNKNKFKIVIFSILEDKNYQEYLLEIKDQTDLLITCDIENSVKNRDIADICQFANEIDLKFIESSLISDSIEKAIDFINENNIEDSLILIAGSLYLAGNFIEQNKL